MTQKVVLIVFILMTAMTVPTPASERRMALDLEFGSVFSGYNDVQVPNPEGTRFSLSEGFSVSTRLYYRLRLTFDIFRRQQISLLFAPLSLNASGAAPEDLRFGEETFLSGEQVNGTYRFNSYRLTYRFQLVDRSRFALWLGFTAKIRDAEISLTSASRQASTTNVGFVPLLNVVIDWRWSRTTGFLAEVDALAAPGGQGRAEDVAASIYYKFSGLGLFRLGYRFVEGGANVPQVYNFAWIHYVFAAVQFRF